VGRVVFTNANLLDGEHPAVAGATVIVDGNRITAVSTPATAPANGSTAAATSHAPAAGVPERQAGDRRIDLRGRTLMPGMVTGHFHATYDEVGARPEPYGLEAPPACQAIVAARNLETALAAGFTGAVSAGAPHDVDASMRLAIRRGLVRGPRFVAGSRELSTTGHANDSMPWYWQSHAWGGMRRCDGEDEFRRAVRDEIKRGAQMIKLFVTGGHGVATPKSQTEMTRAELAAAIAAAHDRGVRVRGHITNKAAILTAVELGIDIIDHADDLDDECIDAIVEAGTFVVPSLLLPTTMLARGQHHHGSDAALRADIDRMRAVLPSANAAGVRLVVGDDYGAAGLPHGTYATELELYVRDCGIAPVDVIRWATANGAALLGRPDDLGLVEAGRRADLIVVDGDPLVDITVLQEPENLVAIMLDGSFVKDQLDGAAQPGTGIPHAIASASASSPTVPFPRASTA
jgi:imidazolonepropionase-like amidohydrolase